MAKKTLTKNEKIDLANKILDFLSDRTVAIKASTVWANIKYMGPEYNVRRMLDRLEYSGMVEKHGESRFLWSIRYREWDRANPFKQRWTAIQKPGKSFNDDEEVEDDEEIDDGLATGNEIDYSEALIEINQRIGKIESWSKAATEDIESLTKRAAPQVIEIKKYDGTVRKLANRIVPPEFKLLVDLATCRRNILLIGPAGCGKSRLAEILADTINMKFGSISCTAGMSESWLIGRSVPNLTAGHNVYEGTEFVDRYETGGIFLLDELDAADPNMMLVINTGLANKYLNLPIRREKPRATRHDDFVCIGTANTSGRGANRVYSGRNQLDESTLDRFRIGTIELDYNKEVETALCPNVVLRAKLWDIRAKIERAGTGLRRVMSTRFIEDAGVLHNHGWDQKTILDRYFVGWTDEERKKVA